MRTVGGLQSVAETRARAVIFVVSASVTAPGAVTCTQDLIIVRRSMGSEAEVLFFLPHDFVE